MEDVQETDSPRPSHDMTRPEGLPDQETPLLQELHPSSSSPLTPEDNNHHLQEDRGPTPAYTEINLADDVEAQHPQPVSEGLPNQNTMNRRSGTIRAFFSHLGGGATAASSSSRPPGSPVAPEGTSTSQIRHVRDNSNHTIMSVASSSSPDRLSPSASRTDFRRGHRASQSGSSMFGNLRKSVHRMGSSASLSPSQQNLTSPSLISLNSIGAPLSHTLTRTEIAYPRGGPTADQIKLISSRESLGRFGVPYGSDAVAFAAASRASLSLGAPPQFDSLMEISGREGATSRASGLGHARGGSGASSGSSSDHHGNGRAGDASNATAAVSAPPETTTFNPATIQPQTTATGLPNATAAAPPSAYRAVDEQPSDVPPVRRESVESSAYSFATARESIDPMNAATAHFDDVEIDIDHEPPTPTASPPPEIPGLRIPGDAGSTESFSGPPTPTRGTIPPVASGHILEPTDATITPAIAAAAARA
jgi:hypothetical protein